MTIKNSEKLVAAGAADSDRIRDLMNYAEAYDSVADELEAMAGFVRHSVTVAKNTAGSYALTTYALAQRLAKRPETADLAPHVENMRNALEQEVPQDQGPARPCAGDPRSRAGDSTVIDEVSVSCSKPRAGASEGAPAHSCQRTRTWLHPWLQPANARLRRRAQTRVSVPHWIGRRLHTSANTDGQCGTDTLICAVRRSRALRLRAARSTTAFTRCTRSPGA
ncbi:MAG TPA: hypothetical protein VF713_07915 [Thermoanaerobaculia bacterium]